MTIFLVLLLTAAAFAFAAYPLLKRKPSLPARSTADEDLEELQSHRDTTYSMLKELEFDYQSGILSKDDYEALRNRYKRKAVYILKDMDSMQEGTGAGDEIENKVLALRQKKGGLLPVGGAGDEIEERVLALRRKTNSPSPNRGASDEIEQKVLALRRKTSIPLRNRGASDETEQKVQVLRRPDSQFCTQCGTRHGPDDRFCAHCGARLFKEDKD